MQIMLYLAIVLPLVLFITILAFLPSKVDRTEPIEGRAESVEGLEPESSPETEPETTDSESL